MIGIILFIVVGFFSFSAISQSSIENEITIVDTSLIKTSCDCCKSLVAVKMRFLENIRVSDDLEIIRESLSTEKTQKLWQDNAAITKKCDQWTQANIEIDDCQACKDLEGVKAEFDLVIRVLEMNRSHIHE
jgi:hypothetical protein